MAVLANTFAVMEVSDSDLVLSVEAFRTEQWTYPDTSDLVFPAFLPETLKESDKFILTIPSINLRKDVVRNVDPVSRDEYLDVINTKIAHGKYTKLPDEAIYSGNVYLFAHRDGTFQGSDMGFFRNLDKLGSADTAMIEYEGKTYIYKFRRSYVVSKYDVGVYNGDTDSPTLTLQTCQNGNTDRLIVEFDLVEVY